MPWYIVALFPTFFFVTTNFIDQFFARKYFPDRPYSCICFAAINNTIVAVLLYCLFPDVLAVPTMMAIKIMGGGMVYMAALFPYIMALQARDASRILPLTQSIPFIVLFLGWLFLDETMDSEDILAAVIIVGSAMFMTYEHGSHAKPHAKSVILILLTSFLFAGYSILLRVFAQELEWYVVSFWVVIGWMVVGYLYWLVMGKQRRYMIDVIKQSKGVALLWDMAQQSCDLMATFILVYVLAFAPTAAHVSLMNGLSPFLWVIVGAVIGSLWPKYFDRVPIDRWFFYRLVAAGFIFLGLYLLIF